MISQLTILSIKESMETTKFKCNYCCKEYSRKSFYKKHVMCCEIVNNSKKENELNREETEDIPSIGQLYSIIKEMNFNYNHLKSDMEEMKKHVYKTKKKVYLLEWLKEKIHPTTNIQTYINNIDINISLLTEHGFEKGLGLLFDKMDNKKDNLPIRCFDQHKNSLFIFENEWKICSDEQFQNIVDILHTKILRIISQISIDANNPDDNFCFVIKKLLNQQTDYSQIKKNMYQQMKSNVMNIIEYEFV